jgi:hypothetical protein
MSEEIVDDTAGVLRRRDDTELGHDRLTDV